MESSADTEDDKEAAKGEGGTWFSLHGTWMKPGNPAATKRPTNAHRLLLSCIACTVSGFYVSPTDAAMDHAAAGVHIGGCAGTGAAHNPIIGQPSVE
eukprot:scaffold3427_cov18-Tisochrysis_lutea.AAC.2